MTDMNDSSATTRASFSRYLQVLRHQWWVILVVTALAVAAAAAYTTTRKSVYESSM